MKTIRTIGLGMLALVLCPSASALQQPAIRFNPEAPLSPLEKAPGERAAYEAIRDQIDPGRRLSLVNQFIADHADSEFMYLVLEVRWQVRVEQGDWAAVVESAEAGLEAQNHFRDAKLGFVTNPSRVAGLAEFRYAMAAREAAYYQSITEAYRNLGDYDRVLEYGESCLAAAAAAWGFYAEVADEGSPAYRAAREQNLETQAFALFNMVEVYESRNDHANAVAHRERILELTPDDLQTLATTARMMALEPPPPGADADAYLGRAESYARRTLEQVAAYYTAPAWTALDAGRRAALGRDAHVALGLIHSRRGDWHGAADAFESSVRAQPMDALAWAVLGTARRELGDVEGWLSAYARAVHLEIPQPRIRADLETVFMARDGSLDGLDAFIEAEGSIIEALGGGLDGSRERTAYIDGLLESLEVLPTVFRPNTFCYQYYEFLASQDLGWAADALEIGVGSGVNSFILLDRGAGRVVGTDINQNAIRTFELNAARLGHEGRIEGRPVPLHEPAAFSVIGRNERFDLIISNPPWEDHEPRRIAEYAYLDSGWTLLRSMLEGLADHLKPDGRVWLLYGDPRVVPTGVAPAVDVVLREAPENGLNATLLYRNARCSIIEVVVNR